MRVWTGLIVAAVACGAAYGGWRLWQGKAPEPAKPPAAVPVTAAKAQPGSVPVYLIGIGTVRALNAVELHPQVGGILVSVPVREGDEVEKGAVLAVIDPRTYQAALDRAKAQLQQDKAQLENAQLDLRRYSSLARNDFASRQQVDTQSANVDRFTGVVAADQAAITEAEINLGFTVLRAPFAGRIGLRRVDPGNLVQANGTGLGIFSLVQDRPITVVFTLPENDLPRVKAAMARGPVPVLADTSDNAQELARGTLLTPDNVVDPTTGTFSAKAIFPNTDGALTPGQFVSTKLQAEIIEGVTVPREAIQHGRDGLFVLAVGEDRKTTQVPVTVSYDNGTVVVIKDKLPAGTTVVVSGQSRVGKGTEVAVRDNPAHPDDAKASQ